MLEYVHCFDANTLILYVRDLRTHRCRILGPVSINTKDRPHSYLLYYVVSNYIRRTVFIFLLPKASLEHYDLPMDDGWCSDFGSLASAWPLSTVGQGTSRENLLGSRLLSASLPKQNVTGVEDSLAVWRREGAAHGLPLAWLYTTVSLSSDNSVTGFKYINL